VILALSSNHLVRRHLDPVSGTTRTMLYS